MAGSTNFSTSTLGTSSALCSWPKLSKRPERSPGGTPPRPTGPEARTGHRRLWRICPRHSRRPLARRGAARLCAPCRRFGALPGAHSPPGAEGPHSAAIEDGDRRASRPQPHARDGGFTTISARSHHPIRTRGSSRTTTGRSTQPRTSAAVPRVLAAPGANVRGGAHGPGGRLRQSGLHLVRGRARRRGRRLGDRLLAGNLVQLPGPESARRRRVPWLRGCPSLGRSGSVRGAHSARRSLPGVGTPATRRSSPTGVRRTSKPMAPGGASASDPSSGDCTSSSGFTRRRSARCPIAARAISQSFLNWTMPLSVSGWLSICWKTLNGSVAMCEPASAASVTWQRMADRGGQHLRFELVESA